MTTAISDRQFEIIEAAGRLLAESGVGGLTIKNLSREMKFSESAIYRHFTSKEEIIVALLEYLENNMDQRLENAISIDQTPEDKFMTLFKNQFSYFNKNPQFVVAVFSDGLMEASKRINEVILKIMAVKTKHLLAILIEGQQKNVFTNEISARELMHIVIGAFRLQMFKWRVANFKFDIRKEGEIMIQSLLKLIKSK